MTEEGSNSKYLPILLAIGAVGVMLLGGVGYAIGASGAADGNDVAAESGLAYKDAYGSSVQSAEAEAKADASKEARADGRRRGAAAGAKAGTARAEEELAAKQAAEEAKRAEANAEPPFIPHSPYQLEPGLVTLPNGRMGWLLPPEGRTLGCVGMEQEPPHQCVGD